MTADIRPVRDDRVLGYTRGLSAAVVPFLLVAFVLLYLFPGETKRLFAWTITPTMTPMTLAAAYFGGAYFFVRAVGARRWNTVKSGYPAVAIFASLLGVATVLHWDRFNHQHPAFWLWAGLYFTAPFLVVLCWVMNRRRAGLPTDEDRVLGRPAQWTIAAIGLLALVQGIVMFLFPAVIIPSWPWTLTPLTCRVLGAIFCLGCAGIGVLIDPRWTSVRLMLQVAMLMVSLILIGAVRARAEFFTDRPLCWLLLGGFVAVLLGSAYLWFSMERRPIERAVY